MLYQKLPIHVNYQKVGAAHEGYQPVLYAYLLDASGEIPSQRERPAVIICPGGGYEYKSDREGEPIAMRFLAAGIHAFVLQYSVAPFRYPCAALELAAAVKLVRENAAKWGVRADSIFIAGFSAGGHLSATLGTLWNEPLFEQALDAEPEMAKGWRPAGMILSYPVITMGEYTHLGSRNNLLGPDASGAQIAALSLETRVSEKTIPAFLWHTYEDGAVPVENTLQFAAALRQAKVSFELHVYERGGHGLALCDETTAESAKTLLPEDANWMEMAIRWVKKRASV